MTKLKSEFEIDCPCCSAKLVVDGNLQRVIRHSEPPSADRPELDNAQRILAEQAARREALFPEVLRRREGPRRRALETVRGSAQTGEPGTHHETHQGLRFGLIWKFGNRGIWKSGLGFPHFAHFQISKSHQLPLGNADQVARFL